MSSFCSPPPLALDGSGRTLNAVMGFLSSDMMKEVVRSCLVSGENKRLVRGRASRMASMGRREVKGSVYKLMKM